MEELVKGSIMTKDISNWEVIRQVPLKEAYLKKPNFPPTGLICVSRLVTTHLEVASK